MDWRQRLPDRRDLLVLLLLFFLPVISFFELFLLDKTLYYRDVVMIHYPLGVLKGRLLGVGQLPLWNPFIEFGFPQLADQDVIALNPLNLLFLLPLSPHLSLSWFVVAHFVVAGVASYVMARGLRMSRVGALIMALAFSLSGYMMAQLTNLPIMTGSVWLPLVFFLFVKTLETRSLSYAILCGGAIALQVFASHPQVVFYTLLALGAYGAFWLYGLWRDAETTPLAKRKGTAVLLSLMALAVAAGLLLAAVQIAPTWELKALSLRATGLSHGMMTVFSLPPYHPLTFLFPGIHGNPVIGFKGEGLFEELHGYVGILPLMLVPWAWLKRKYDRNVTFFALLAGFSLLLALGRYTPLYGLLVHVPGFNFFRVPARWLLTVTFSLSVLAGYGYDALVGDRAGLESSRFSSFWRILGWLNLAFSLMLLTGVAFGQQVAQRLETLGTGLVPEQWLGRILILVRGLIRLPLIQLSDNPGMTLASLNPVLLFVFFSNAGFLLICLWNKRRIKAPAFQILLVGLIVVDLLLAGGTAINPVREGSYYARQTGSTSFLQQNLGLYRVFSLGREDMVEYLLEDMATAYGLYSAQGHVSQLALRRYEVFLEALGESETLRNLAGVKYALVEKGTELPGYTSAYTGGGHEVYENESVLPRAFVVYEVEVIPLEQAVLSRLLSEGFDPGRSVILEEEPLPVQDQGDRLAAKAESPGSVPSTGDVYLPLVSRNWPPSPNIALYSPHKVVIETELQADGFLVLTDTYYPGWQVFVDGREDRIYQADYLFRAVPLRQGKHTVEFRYSPPSFRTGLAVSMLAGVLLIAIALSSSLIRRRRGRGILLEDV